MSILRENLALMKRSLYITVIFLLIFRSAQSQHQDTSNTQNIIPWRLGLVVGGTAGLIVTAHFQNYNSWWKGTHGPFHLSVDDAYSLGADKCGHLIFSYIAADVIGRSLNWSGIERNKALQYGGIISFAFQLYVEVEDGFHPELGFSIGDVAVNGIGAAFPLLRENNHFFSTISPKWSTNPSERYEQHRYRTIIDDYESQTYWLSFNLRDIIGESMPRVIPSFLNVALGYGVTDLDLQGNGSRELYLSLDIDINKLPGDGDLLIALKHVLNFFHVPAPTIRLTPSVIVYGLRF